jgi:1-acyl-sn-glycerol-3-phosphate acyltransferase
LYAGIVSVFLIALPTLFLPPKFTLLFGKFLGYYVVFIVRIFLNTKVEIKGIGNIPRTEKYFVASAHQSMFETFALQAVLDYPVFILKKELLKIPIFGLYLKKIKSIEIIRDTTTKDNLSFFDKVATIIKNENRPLLIFPQGTRIKADERVPFKKGVGRIYEALNISCIPIALNSGKVWPKKGIIKYPGKITISLLEPIKPGLSRDEFIKNLENKIYDEIKNIS